MLLPLGYHQQFLSISLLPDWVVGSSVSAMKVVGRILVRASHVLLLWVVRHNMV
jgi:hypothetical protein